MPRIPPVVGMKSGFSHLLWTDNRNPAMNHADYLIGARHQTHHIAIPASNRLTNMSALVTSVLSSPSELTQTTGWSLLRTWLGWRHSTGVNEKATGLASEMSGIVGSNWGWHLNKLDLVIRATREGPESKPWERWQKRAKLRVWCFSSVSLTKWPRVCVDSEVSQTKVPSILQITRKYLWDICTERMDAFSDKYNGYTKHR